MDNGAGAAQLDYKAEAQRILEIKQQLLAARKDAEIQEPTPTFKMRFYRLLKLVCRCIGFVHAFPSTLHLCLTPRVSIKPDRTCGKLLSIDKD